MDAVGHVLLQSARGSAGARAFGFMGGWLGCLPGHVDGSAGGGV